MLGNIFCVRSDSKRNSPTQIIWSRGHELSPVLHDGRNIVPEAHARAEEHRGNGVKVYFELRHDAEVSPSSAQRPKQLGVFRGTSTNERSIRHDQRETRDVVTRQAVQTVQPPRSAAQYQAGGSGVRHHASGKGEARCLCGSIDIAEKAAALKSSTSRLRVNT